MNVRLLFASLLVAISSPVIATAQEDDEFRSGLKAKFSAAGRVVERIDSSLALRVGANETIDDRLPIGPFRAEWNGLLQSQAPGEYRVHAFLQGTLRIELGGRLILEAANNKPGWVVSQPIEELAFDWHPLKVVFAGGSGQAELRLFWSGPGFGLEPISARRLFHETGEAKAPAPLDGQAWVDALRCVACHRNASTTPPESAPSLLRIKGQLQPNWLVDWLQQHSPPEDESGSSALQRRMPYFGLQRDEAIAISAFLFSVAEQPEFAAKAPNRTTAKPKKKKQKTNASPSTPDADKGRQLVLTIGCLACHTYRETGEDNLYGGSDLTRIAEKRPANFFRRWLETPEALNAAHRMPVFEFAADELNHLEAFLTSCSSKPHADEAASAAPVERAFTDAAIVERGRRLTLEHGCAACHEIKGVSSQAVTLTPEQLRRSGCADGPSARAGSTRPAYHLKTAPKSAVLDYFRAASLQSRGNNQQAPGDLLLKRRNCQSCHQRDTSAGLARRLTRTIDDFPELAAQTPAMTPPSLISVGDKLHDAALVDAIRKPNNKHRPWLLVRMPRYRISDGEVRQLAERLIVADRIPDHAKATAAPSSDEAHGVVGARLVTPDGFGCTSCHQVGSAKPPKAPLNAKGPNLLELGNRIRYPWYQRWVRNPARIVPRMEMPSVQLPVSGVLNDNLDRQLDTVWNVLNDPGFRPPMPNPVRVVRTLGRPELKQKAEILTDVLQRGDEQFIKPLVIGLPNRHNILFDLEHGRIAGWWIGDTARQRTKGKTWYWEPGAEDMLGGPAKESSLHWQPSEGEQRAPLRSGQFVTELDGWRHTTGGGVELTQRLRFDLDGAIKTLRVTHLLWPIWPGEGRRGGFEHQLKILTDGATGRLTLPLLNSKLAATLVPGAAPNEYVWNTGVGGSKHLFSTQPLDEKQGFVGISLGGKQRMMGFRFEASAAPDQYPVPPKLPNLDEPIALDSTPGFESVRLPVSGDIMPTGFAWRPNGQLVVTSLKGRVWLANDTNGDGLEDQLRQFSDELAAPFGAYATADYIDVINKYALLRLYDRDGDGRADETQTLASGWGHTADYHDWAIGLPRDQEGNYWIATACQQDKRSKAAAKLRGAVMKLTPRQTTPANPQAFQIETVSTGHRFPIGIARNRAGQTFVTDNQGNYNPFNELNHVVQGRAYGFINAIDRNPRFRIPPLTPPAVNIPHPWTRSVNGVCFLDTPSGLGKSSFGPFEGHLIGAEYDTRRLIRVSLQEVNGWMQGAAYPFSDYHPQGGATFLGPLTCAVSPRGELLVGCIRDSGWGGANNIGTIVRMRFQPEALPAGIAEVRARADGFEIRFTRPVDERRANELASYTVSSYTRTSTPAYGGPDQERRKETVTGVQLATDRLSVRLALPMLRPGFVYEIRTRNLSPDDAAFFPAEAFYSLQQIPR